MATAFLGRPRRREVPGEGWRRRLCAFGCAALLAGSALPTEARSVPSSPPKRLIIDTDMSTDCDDVGALCAAHALERQGVIRILAVVHDNGLLQGVGAVSSINHFFGRDDIPLGAYRGAFGAGMPGPYVPSLVASAPGPVVDLSHVPEAVSVYRRVLAAQPPRSVTIVSLGFATNLEALLRSPPDEHSDLNGVALVASRVEALTWMGGQYPTSGTWHEWNFGGGGSPGPQDPPSPVAVGATSYVLEHLPTSVKVTFLGFEAGVGIMSGAALSTCAPPENPCRKAYVLFGGERKDRNSWDPATLLVAALGAEAVGFEVAGKDGRNTVDATSGANTWQPFAGYVLREHQTYLVLPEGRNRTIGRKIDELLCESAAGASSAAPISI